MKESEMGNMEAANRSRRVREGLQELVESGGSLIATRLQAHPKIDDYLRDMSWVLRYTADLKALLERSRSGEVTLEELQHMGAFFTKHVVEPDLTGPECVDAHLFKSGIASKWDPSLKKFETNRDIYLAELGVACSRWMKGAFPTVTFDNECLPASLVATSVGKDAAEDIASPWDCFVVELPAGFLPTSTDAGKVSYAKYLVIQNLRSNWGIDIVRADRTVQSFRPYFMERYLPELPADETIQALLEMLEGEAERDAEGTDAANCRSYMAAIRLVFGVCMELSDVSKLTAKTKRPERKSLFSLKNKGMHTDPPKTFVIGRNVTIDCRQHISDYLHHRTSSIASVRTLVRGHWKRQPFGVGRSERKYIQVEPYWRGPEDGPAIVRSHVLNREV